VNFLFVGGVSGFLVVMLGAFGAHGLKDILDEYGIAIYDKAVLYQMFHTVAILIIGMLNKIHPELSFSLAGWSFLIGIIIFSGSLYILSITGIKWLGAITPIGGLFLIAGWLLFFINIK